MLDKEKVLTILKDVNFPGFTRDIVSFGMVKDIIVDNDVVELELSISSQNEEKKKEVIIKKRYKNIQNLDSFAKEDKVIIETASAINQKNPTIPGTGNEPFVVGAAFALNEGKTSSLIAGENGGYMVVLL